MTKLKSRMGKRRILRKTEFDYEPALERMYFLPDFLTGRAIREIAREAKRRYKLKDGLKAIKQFIEENVGFVFYRFKNDSGYAFIGQMVSHEEDGEKTFMVVLNSKVWEKYAGLQVFEFRNVDALVHEVAHVFQNITKFDSHRRARERDAVIFTLNVFHRMGFPRDTVDLVFEKDQRNWERYLRLVKRSYYGDGEKRIILGEGRVFNLKKDITKSYYKLLKNELLKSLDAREIKDVIKDVIRSLDKELGEQGIPIDRIFEEAEKAGVSKERVGEIIKGLKRDCELFEPRDGIIRRTR